MRKLPAILAAASLGIMIGHLAGTRSQADDSAARATQSERNKAEIDKLRQKKLELAEQRYKAVSESFNAANEPLSSLYTASICWKDSAFEVAKSANDRRSALEQHSERMQELHKLVKAMFDAGRKGGEQANLVTAGFWELEAKIWVLQD